RTTSPPQQIRKPVVAVRMRDNQILQLRQRHPILSRLRRYLRRKINQNAFRRIRRLNIEGGALAAILRLPCPSHLTIATATPQTWIKLPGRRSQKSQLHLSLLRDMLGATYEYRPRPEPHEGQTPGLALWTSHGLAPRRQRSPFLRKHCEPGQ